MGRVQATFISELDRLKRLAVDPLFWGDPPSRDAVNGEYVVRNQRCGDAIRAAVVLRSGVVCEVWFQGSSCMLGRAAATLIGYTLRGASYADILRLNYDAVFEPMGMRLGPNRALCVRMAWNIVEQLHADLLDKKYDSA